MKKALLALLPAAALALTACGGGSDSGAAANDSRGPITIWYSNNAQEVAWARAWWRPGTPPTPRRR